MLISVLVERGSCDTQADHEFIIPHLREFRVGGDFRFYRQLIAGDAGDGNGHEYFCRRGGKGSGTSGEWYNQEASKACAVKVGFWLIGSTKALS